MQPTLRNVGGALRADLLLQQAQRIRPNARRILSALMAVVILVAAVALSAIPSVTNAAQTNVLVNGGFESGFSSQPGCGSVGNGWNCFTNGGRVNTAFHDDGWAPVLADGAHAQLISMDTRGIGDGEADRYAGILQTVRVVPGQTYTLNLRGMIRTTNTSGDADPYRYVVQVGTSAGAFPNWAAVSDWKDTGWYTYYPREAPGELSTYSAPVVATDNYVTLYVRLWKKWANAEEEVNVNLDAITLTGEAPFGTGGTGGGSIGSNVIYQGVANATGTTTSQAAQACTSEFVYNGSFENGFNATVAGAVGKGWGFFTNGGAANFGFHDDQWNRVIAEGSHSQLMAIDTRGRWPADGDRYIGIFQHVTRLIPGQTYELSLKGILRGEGGSDDPYRYEAQWGYNSGGNSNWMQVSNWTGMDLGPISPRSDPVGMGEYRVSFVAPATSITLFIRGWDKWPVSEQEMNLNVDAISLRGCGTGGVQPPTGVCVHIVRPGDTLSKIAVTYGTTVTVLQRLNGIVNPNIIYVGQQIRLPNCEPTTPPVTPPQPPTTSRTWLVRPGDTLAKIAAACGTTVWALAQANGITNPNLIFVGQVLRIP